MSNRYIAKISEISLVAREYYVQTDVDKSEGGEENPVTLFYATLRAIEDDYGENGIWFDPYWIGQFIEACRELMPEPTLTLSDALDGMDSPLSWEDIAYASLLATVEARALELLAQDGVDVKLKDAERIRMCAEL